MAADSPVVRTVRFPVDRSMGMLFIRDAGPCPLPPWWEDLPGDAEPVTGAEPLDAAQGEVTVPAEKALVLVVPRTVQDLTPLRALNADDLQGLIFEALHPEP